MITAENRKLQKEKRSTVYELSQKMEEINDLKQQYQSADNNSN